jgi:uncharacterized protein
MTDLACPKCGGRLRTYERSEIVIERCDACRGIFLDRGELECLIEAEGALLYREMAESKSPQRKPKPDRMGKQRMPITERILGAR